MKELIRTKDQIEKAFYGGAWHGPSVMETLEGITSAEALQKPVNGAHSIWEIVLHIDVWHKTVRERLLGFPSEPVGEDDWQPVKDKSPKAWEQSVENLKRSLTELLDTLSGFDESKLLETTVGKDYSNYFMLHGLVQHDVYHAGQITLLKKSLK